MASTIAKEKRRDLTNTLTPPAAVGFTSQILFSADCSSPKTLEAPNSNMIIPIAEATP